MEQIKDWLINGLLVLAAFLIGFFLVELSLRILPASITGISRDFPLIADPDVAFRHKPNTSMFIETQCFAAQFSTNSLGFRDVEWSVPQDIVVLGDSFMEAAQVNDGDDFSSEFERLTGNTVANTGAASFNTVAELAAYEKFGRPLKPKIVILAFFAGNDVTGNNCAYAQGPDGTVRNPCGEIQNGEVVFPTNFYSTSGTHSIRSFVRENCRLCKLANDFLASSRARPAGTSREDMALYLPEGTAGEEIDVSWRITEETLRRLRDAVAADGAELIVMSIPEYVNTSRTGEEDYMKEHGIASLPEDFNLNEPQQRLATVLSELDIPLLDLEDPFIAYRDEHDLQAPYFSYVCDGHWNELGHTLAARIVAEYLANE